MTTAYTGGDTAVVKTYKDMAAELKKDPAYVGGQAFQKLKAFSYVERKDPRFAKMVDGFVKKFPDGYFAKQAQALVTKELPRTNWCRCTVQLSWLSQRRIALLILFPERISSTSGA
jgi:hypothetical protein